MPSNGLGRIDSPPCVDLDAQTAEASSLGIAYLRCSGNERGTATRCVKTASCVICGTEDSEVGTPSAVQRGVYDSTRRVEALTVRQRGTYVDTP